MGNRDSMEQKSLRSGCPVASEQKIGLAARKNGSEQSAIHTQKEIFLKNFLQRMTVKLGYFYKMIVYLLSSKKTTNIGNLLDDWGWNWSRSLHRKGNVRLIQD
ncbi:hypothetical protein AVEN_259684-1 [Araneus ventricosus]|uniref:Uncharacterized protein n=1 Tax=Araneus ventricosus TaxID=182803 RepID=A0A4Y2NSA9_ARAVE|nr:hypothetical protein AVEN_259684-1 [Araneus ventricosus]